MGIQVEDGKGTGKLLGVNKENRLLAVSINHEMQHHESWHSGQCYQFIGEITGVSNDTQSVLHIRNDSSTHKIVISYIRIQGDESGATPDEDSYWEIGFGTTYSAGGSTATPVNMNRASGNAADATVYIDATVTGTFIQADRWQQESNGAMMTYNKHGSIILGKNDTIELRYSTAQTDAGAELWCRLTGFFIPNE